MPLDNLSHDSGTGRRRHHSESLTRGVHGYEPVRGIAARATSDLLLTTLKRYVAATGGELHLVVTYPDSGPVDVKIADPETVN